MKDNRPHPPLGVLGLFSVFSLLSGCSPRIALSIRAEQSVSSTGPARPLLPKDKLASGQSLAFWARVDSPSYIYALSYSETDWSSLIFPKSGIFLARSGDWIRIPQGRDVVTLDHEPGVERFVLIARAKPLDATSCAELRLFCPEQDGNREHRGSRGNDDKEKPKPKPTTPPPVTAPGKSNKDRDLHLIEDVVPGRWIVREWGTGQVTIPFPIEHTPG